MESGRKSDVINPYIKYKASVRVELYEKIVKVFHDLGIKNIVIDTK